MAPLAGVESATDAVAAVPAAPMSYWRTVGWRLGRDRTTLAAGGGLLVIVLATFFVLLNLVVDLVQTLVDPRIARH